MAALILHPFDQPRLSSELGSGGAASPASARVRCALPTSSRLAESRFRRQVLAAGASVKHQATSRRSS
jgi:hypothetical protein